MISIRRCNLSERAIFGQRDCVLLWVAEKINLYDLRVHRLHLFVSQCSRNNDGRVSANIAPESARKGVEHFQVTLVVFECKSKIVGRLDGQGNRKWKRRHERGACLTGRKDQRYKCGQILELTARHGYRQK